MDGQWVSVVRVTLRREKGGGGPRPPQGIPYPVRVALFGKPNMILHWLEDVAEDLTGSGHDVYCFRYRDPRLNRSLEQALMWRGIGAPLSVVIARRPRRLAPDLVLAFGGWSWIPWRCFSI